MELNTASSTISFARKLEEDSARFYQNLALKFPDKKDAFIAFAAENKKYIAQVERSYYSVISDAIEGCFAFKINPAEYELNSVVTNTYQDALKQAGEIEDRIIRFYTDAAAQSACLLADVPRTMSQIAKKRAARVLKLKEI